jgi:hypothetical protein
MQAGPEAYFKRSSGKIRPIKYLFRMHTFQSIVIDIRRYHTLFSGPEDRLRYLDLSFTNLRGWRDQWPRPTELRRSRAV